MSHFIKETAAATAGIIEMYLEDHVGPLEI